MTECWLWPEVDAIRWWMPDATGRLHIDAPKGQWARLRDGLEQTDFRNALPVELARVLESALATEESLCLRLADGLPADWQSFAFEWLRDRGTPLQRRLFVERHVPLQVSPTQCMDKQQVAILNLWPEGEPEQSFRDLALHDLVKIYDSIKLAEDYMVRADLSRHSLLVVIGHGTEQNLPQPLLAEGKPWSLPLGRGLPDVVVLVACGSEDGSLLAYGKTLLEAGAKAVLAPVGKLDAKPAGVFLRNFLQEWLQGSRLDRILSTQQTLPENQHAAWRYCLLGQGAIRLGKPEEPTEWPDVALTEAARNGQPEALRLLVERITLRCYQEEGHLDSAEKRLRTALSASLHDAPAETRLLAMLDPIAGQLPVLGKSWVLPLLGSFSEAYNHSLLKKYDRLCRTSGLLKEAPSTAQHYLSKIPYRLGRYPESAKKVAVALAGLPGLEEEAIRPLGQLLNLMIDLNLTPLAVVVAERLRQCINANGGANRDTHNHSRLDRDARLALRQGNPKIALERFAIKRRQALDNGENGRRELPWLLYAAAWDNPGGAEAKSYADHAKQELADPAKVAKEIAQGNADEAYLMRALALWCWRAKDREAAELLLHYADFWRDCLDSVRDSGPVGLAVAYMHLYDWGGPVPDALPSLEKAEANLGEESYWLELAALFALFGKPDEAKAYLGRFHNDRKDALGHWRQLPDWLGLDAWAEVEAEQSRIETKTLLAGQTPDPIRLVETGLLPL